MYNNIRHGYVNNEGLLEITTLSVSLFAFTSPPEGHVYNLCYSIACKFFVRAHKSYI